MNAYRLGVPLIVVVALACSGGDSARGGSLAVTVDTVGGVETVHNSGTAPEWTLQESVVIGGPDEGPSGFSLISSITADDKGNIYVMDRQSSEVRVFDASGDHVRTFGRRGEGPSEFGTVYALAWLDDLLIALDPINSRLGAMTAAGEWVGAIPHLRLTGSGIRLDQVGPAEIYTIGVGRRNPDGTSAPNHYRYRLVAGDGDANEGIVMPGRGRVVVDTIPFPHVPAASTSAVRCDNPADRSMSFFAVPFGAGGITIPIRDELTAAVRTSDYKIAFVRGLVDTVRTITREHSPAPVSDSAWEAGQADFRTYRTRNPGATCEVNEMTRPAVQPAIGGMFYDDEGHLWVEVITTEGRILDVFAPSGRQVGRTQSPERVRSVPVIVRAQKMYTVVADSLGVQSVRVLNIQR